ncbi:TIGR03086 family metal-binding protein [Amycolatopsis sp. NBC_01488]|uniref:TIGR03086 family metal-binding protein n=1 Tax=Amycolatopsis sp. NBC_01488 TaxID=2903563 RepID=UPI002E2E6CB5|nr:TIGR03086 family metal-binding protein [Amycolatopsis sp. NBC_01488]
MPLLDDLALASAATGDLLDRVEPGQWTTPTPCDEWTVRDLAGHLVGMDLVLTAMFSDAPPPGRDVDHLGADPAAAFRRSSAALRGAASLPEVLERVQTTPVGTTTGAERLRWRIADLLAHSWDLAQATGVPADVPDDLAERSLSFTRAQLPSQRRGGRFAEPRPVAPGASPLDRLAAFTGRTVPWPGTPSA